MDLYSNMLYVKGEKYYLQVLANKAVEIDKYRVETCCIVGMDCYRDLNTDSMLYLHNLILAWFCYCWRLKNIRR
jgi:hypothetical protein